jgi:carboxyl-terminal processing protease
MRKFLAFFFISVVLISTVLSADDLTVKELKPEPQHQRVVQKVTQILTRLHYKNVNIDDSLSTHLFTKYIEYLDYNKSYFLAADVKEFEKFRYNFDQYLTTGNLDPVFFIFNRFQKRMTERLDYVFKRIEEPFDFTIDEYYEPARDSLDWAVNKQELDDYWRKRVKNEYLSLKISGKEEDKIKEILVKRYTNLKRRLSQNQSEDVVQVYLNALSNIFDPHTNYFSPKATDDFKIRMQQSLEGIGARLSTENEYTKIIEIIPGGPADKASNINQNDYIVAVGQDTDGELVDVIGWRIDDVVQLIRGPKDSFVRLQVLHNANDIVSDAETITLKRDKIKLEDSAAKADTTHIRSNGQTFVLGVITIPAFYLDYEAQRSGDPNYKSTSRDVEKILKNFKDQGVDGIIIDLRENGGGFLSEAVELTGLFIDEGPVVQVRDSRGEVKVEEDMDPGLAYSGPMAVLVDEFSASASEIFAAAIQDYKRGIIVGNQTYGKGTVQNMWDLNRFLPGNSNKYGEVKLTIAKFYRINGGSTQHLGVIPDIELPSRFDHNEVGESSQDNALLWDQIASVNYENQHKKVETFLPSLKLNHHSRTESDGAFAQYVDAIQDYKKSRENNRYALNEEKRKADKEKNKKLEEEEQNEEKEDYLLTESRNILADYIYLLKNK